jgi:hypothetical protein
MRDAAYALVDIGRLHKKSTEACSTLQTPPKESPVDPFEHRS